MASPVRATQPSTPITVELAMPTLPSLNQSVPVSVTVTSMQDAPDTRVELVLSPGITALTSGWTVNLIANQPVTFTSSVIAQTAGNGTVSARALSPRGGDEVWGDMKSLPLHVGSPGALPSGPAWRIDTVPVAGEGSPGNAPIVSREPTPFIFPPPRPPGAPAEIEPSVTAMRAATNPPQAPPDAPGFITLTGRWLYTNRAGAQVPIDQQLIEVVHGDGTALSPNAYCFTDVSGNYSCTVPTQATSVRVWVRSWANFNRPGGQDRLGVFSGPETTGGCGSDAIGCSYPVQTPAVSCADGQTCAVGTWVVDAGTGDPYQAAHWMTQDLIQSWKKLFFDTKHGTGVTAGAARINYPVPAGHGTHAHVPSPPNSGWISIEPPNQTSAHVVTHEYGHVVMANLWAGFSPNWPTSDCPSPHFIQSPSGPGCALSEGFANFWSWYSTNNPVYLFGSGSTLNFETRSGFASGDQVEGNVAAAMGDMFDASNDGTAGTPNDRLSDGVQHIWHTTSQQGNSNFAGWWSTYLALSHDPCAALDILKFNTISYTLAGCNSSVGLSSSPNPSNFTQPVTFTATVAGASPTGTVTFVEGATTLGTVSIGAGTATLTRSDLSAGAHSIRAIYNPGNLGASQSSLLTHTVQSVTPPANNDFVNAAIISGNSGTTAGSNVGATKQGGEPAHAGNPGGTSVWWQWTPAVNGSATITTVGSTFDTLLAVYTGSSVSGLSAVASNDDCGSLQSCVTFAVTGGTPYRIAVDGFNGGSGAATGAITLNWSLTSSQVAQTISFTTTAPTNARVGGPTYTVGAIATSGLTVTITVAPASASVCSLAGATVSFIGVGTCTLNANQPGNAAFLPAPQVQQSFAVTGGVALDFNADGKGDILWRQTSSGLVAAWLMNGPSLLAGPLLGGAPSNWTIVGTGDFDGDGKVDILWRDSSGLLAMWLLNGTTLTAGPLVASVPMTWSIVGVGDFNGDGKADILWRGPAGEVAIWMMNGATVTAGPLVASVALTWTISRVGDFDGDGKSDILWRGPAGEVAVWLMNGATIVAGPLVAGAPLTWTIASAGDFNGDGKSDILWRGPGGEVAIWFMNGGTLVSGPIVGGAAANWNIVGSSDFDGDTKADILWRDNTGLLAAWFMNGPTLVSGPLISPVPLDWVINAPK